jgi:hypothetical protein
MAGSLSPKLSLFAAYSLQKLVVVSVGADPEPDDGVIVIEAEGAVVSPDADGPKLTNSFEMQRRVMRIGFEKLKVFVRQFTDAVRETAIMSPEAR